MKLKAQDENVIIPKNIKKQHFKILADYKEQLCKKPDLRMLFIEMTLNCNEHCRHCGSWCGDVKVEGTLTDDEIVNMLEGLKTKVPERDDGRTKLPFLNITGGEPLVRPGFVELMTRIHELGYRWGMTSNGLLIDEKMAESLKKAGMSTVSISIDGLEKSHDWFRQSKGGYKKAMNAIRVLKKQNFKNVMVTTVVHKRNVNELDELYGVIKATGCDTWRIINVEPIGRAIDNDEIALTNDDYRYIIDFIMKHRASDNEMEVAYGCNHFLGPKREKELRPWYFLCTAGVYTGGIFYNGDIGACLDIERKPETIQGNIRTDDFYDVWLNRFEIYRIDRSAKSKTCHDCKYRYVCRGDGFHTWDIDNNEPKLCMYRVLKKKDE